MKKNVRFFALIMSILMILSFASACDRTSSTEETQYSSDTEKAITTETETESADTSSSTTDTDSESTAPESSEESSSQSSDTADTEETTDTEETDKPKETHTIIENKKTEYTMVIPDSNSTEFTKHANDLRASFLEEFSVTVQMIKESTYKTIHGGNMDGKKIVLGVLKNDPISSDIQKSLTYNTFSIQMVNGSLYIIGYNAETTHLAIEYFIQTYMLCDHSDTLKFDDVIIYETKAAFPVGNITIGGNHIATYSIVYYDSH